MITTSIETTLDTLVIGAGQAGLATAYHLKKQGLSFLVLEASHEPVGSWRRYYDSLVLFSPARFSSLPGMPFPGDPDRFPTGSEVVEYLAEYARFFDFPIRLNSRVTELKRNDHGIFEAQSKDGTTYRAHTVVVATGSFAYPNLPKIGGLDLFKGRSIHAIDYKNPEPFHGKKVIVVGAGNTAIQIAHELTSVADVTLATRGPIRYFPQRILGKDLHWWFHYTRLDRSCLLSDQSTPVLDDGRYRSAIRSGQIKHRPVFERFTETGVVWSDGSEEKIDSVIYGTGYQSKADFLSGLGALDDRGLIAQKKGRSTQVPGLYYVGFSLQRNFASATLRGVGPDAAAMVGLIQRQLKTSAATPRSLPALQ